MRRIIDDEKARARRKGNDTRRAALPSAIVGDDDKARYPVGVGKNLARPVLLLLIFGVIVLLVCQPDTTGLTMPFTKRGAYKPSKVERDMMKKSRSELHYDVDHADDCDLYNNETRSEYKQYRAYADMLDNYYSAMKKFSVNVPDIRRASTEKRHRMCDSMDTLLKKAFKTDDSLSWTRAGFVEPLLPPLRHPRMCGIPVGMERRKWILNIDYLVHDFGKICRELKPGSRTVFMDIGASLEFHGGEDNPALQLLNLYSKFGIKFDHYFAYEYTEIPPQTVYDKIPEELLSSYHWYNVGVESDPSSKRNPWKSVLSRFDEDDLVVVKLDIDTSSIEVPLVHQLRKGEYSRIVDQFYFEHHVKMNYMYRCWDKTANGTLQDSLDLFTGLREMGIAAHSWV